jgi:hypothetical protein
MTLNGSLIAIAAGNVQNWQLHKIKIPELYDLVSDCHYYLRLYNSLADDNAWNNMSWSELIVSIDAFTKTIKNTMFNNAHFTDIRLKTIFYLIPIFKYNGNTIILSALICANWTKEFKHIVKFFTENNIIIGHSFESCNWPKGEIQIMLAHTYSPYETTDYFNYMMLNFKNFGDIDPYIIEKLTKLGKNISPYLLLYRLYMNRRPVYPSLLKRLLEYMIKTIDRNVLEHILYLTVGIESKQWENEHMGYKTTILDLYNSLS